MKVLGLVKRLILVRFHPFFEIQKFNKKTEDLFQG